MGSGNKQGEVLKVSSVVQVGRLARVHYGDEGRYVYIHMDKLSPSLKSKLI